MFETLPLLIFPKTQVIFRWFRISAISISKIHSLITPLIFFIYLLPPGSTKYYNILTIQNCFGIISLKKDSVWWHFSLNLLQGHLFIFLKNKVWRMLNNTKDWSTLFFGNINKCPCQWVLMVSRKPNSSSRYCIKLLVWPIESEPF